MALLAVRLARIDRRSGRYQGPHLGLRRRNRQSRCLNGSQSAPQRQVCCLLYTSTRAHFAAWLGVNVGDVGPWWDPIAEELTPVVFRGKVWVHTDDLDVLRSRPTPRGVRLLPPRDPYTQLRDRDTIVDRHNHGEVWKTAGDPGTLLIDGEIAGVWRPRKTGAKVTVGVRAFDALPDRTQALVRDEAEQLALLRGAKSAVVDFAVV